MSADSDSPSTEIWLRTNARALRLGMILPFLAGVIGVILVSGMVFPATWLRVLGGLLIALAAATIIALLLQMRRPRLAFRDRRLLVYLRSGPAIEVPIEVVECFWLGQAPSLLPLKDHEKSEVLSVVIRIADAAAEWRHQEVKPQLGMWCEGYITIRGTWCEPLDIQLVNRLNQRLAEVSPSAAHKN